MLFHCLYYFEIISRVQHTNIFNLESREAELSRALTRATWIPGDEQYLDNNK
jgi:hypothetical protein